MVMFLAASMVCVYLCLLIRTFESQESEKESKDRNDEDLKVSKTNSKCIALGMVFCYQNCSYLLWDKIVLVIEKNFWNSRLKTENLQKFWDHKINSFEPWEVRTIFETECFLTCSWRFLRSNTSDQLKFKLEKNVGI